MKDCIRDAYLCYHHPLYKEFRNEEKNLPLLFGRKKKEEALIEKYRQKGLKVVRYEDFKYGSIGVLAGEARGGFKACADFLGNGHYVCGIDGSPVEHCEFCRSGQDCKKLQNYLFSDLFD